MGMGMGMGLEEGILGIVFERQLFGIDVDGNMFRRFQREYCEDLKMRFNIDGRSCFSRSFGVGVLSRVYELERCGGLEVFRWMVYYYQVFLMEYDWYLIVFE